MNKGKNNKTSSVQGEIFGDFTSSFSTDIKMYKEDILVSIAYSKMLNKVGLITSDENNSIVTALEEILIEIQSNKFTWDPSLEDIHLNIEKSLYDKIGDTAGKLHFGRSRNDQVATDVRLYFMNNISLLSKEFKDFLLAIVNLAEKNSSVIMPGYTHLQKGQPVLLPHYLMAYFSILSRDLDRLENCYENMNVMPLGSGAFAGVTIPIDRKFLANELGFKNISDNSIDSVSSRDHILDLLYSLSSIMINTSRICEEFIIWSTDEFGFINLPENFTTGSSIMPQKRNPDYLELVRGKTGNSIGNLISLMTTLKGLPFTYNRDLQEDKSIILEAIGSVVSCLALMPRLILTLKVNKERALIFSKQDYSNATDLADYLSMKGVPFRTSHEIVGKIVKYAESKNISLNEISLDVFKTFSNKINKDVYTSIDVEKSIHTKKAIGASSPANVRKEAKKILSALKVYGYK